MKTKQYTIKVGDSPQRIAQNELNDVTRWTEIVMLNDLDYPFITNIEDSNPKVKTIGDVILIPVVNTLVTDTDDTHSINTFDTDILIHLGEFTLDPATEDLTIVNGVQGLYQELIRRLFTPLGSLLYHPEYGSNFSDIVGSKSDPHKITRASLELQKVFRSNPWVIDVKNISISQSSNKLELYCDIVTAEGITPLYWRED